MKINHFISLSSFRKLAIVLLLAVSTVGAFATLGTGRDKKGKTGKSSLLSIRSYQNPGSFSLQSGFNFRGSQVISNQENKYINLNTMVSYQQGHTTYIMPLKKKVALNGRVTFNPNAATR